MTYIACFAISQMDDDCYRTLYSRSSPQRQERANACLRREDKLRCIASDALTRYALRQMSERNDLTVSVNKYGKPYIPDAPDFHFNLSHSGRWVVIAYGGSPVGIDVQQLRSDAPIEKLTRRHFTADEQAYILCADGQEQVARFYQVWTGKESYLKYLGTGLRIPLASFHVVPDGSLPDVCLTYRQLEDHCLCLFAPAKEVILTILHKQDLLA